jgi:hypothetical protein
VDRVLSERMPVRIFSPVAWLKTGWMGFLINEWEGYNLIVTKQSTIKVDTVIKDFTLFGEEVS